MKNVTWLFIAGLLLPAFTVQAQKKGGENEFTISTQIRPRAEYRNGVLTPRQEGQEPATFINNRARLSMEYNRHDLTMKFSGQHVGVWGQQKQVETEGTFMLNEAWARMKFGKGFFGQLGRQSLVYDDERILGGLDWNVSGRYHDALKLGFENKYHRLHVILAYNQAKENLIGDPYYTGGQPYKNMQTLWYNFSSGDYPFSASVLFMNLGLEGGVLSEDENKPNTRYLRTTGTHLKYSPSSWDLTGTFYYQFGKNTTGRDVSAFMASARVQYHFTDQWNLFIATDYLSGNKSDSDKFNAFDPLYGTHHKFYGSMDYFYASKWREVDGKEIVKPGLWDNYAGIGFKPCHKVNFGLNYHYFLTAQKIKDNNVDLDKDLGHEIDFQVDWAIMKDVKLSAGYSFMLGTETMDYAKGGNHKSWQDWGWLSVNINPKVLFVKW